VDLDDFGRMIEIIDACFLGLAEPCPAYDDTDGPQHPVPGIQPCPG